MYPPIFEICAADADVQTNLGTSPTRLYAFGEASQGVALPYAVWQVVGGLPENYMDQVPDMDSWSIQIDVYGTSDSQVRDAAQSLRDAVEPSAHITSWGYQGRDPDTKNYRYTFRVDWWIDRDTQS